MKKEKLYKKNGFIETENEEYFILHCQHPYLKVHRENLLLKACMVLPSFNYLIDTGVPTVQL